MPTESRHGTFAPTRWSLVLAARGDDPSTARVALGELCRLYWYPLYSFARRRQFSPQDAEDLTQDFFLRLVDTPLLASPDPQRGKLRTFLLTAFQRDLEDARKAARRLKRGGGIAPLPLDTTGAESLFQLEPAHPATPETHFAREWAQAVLADALQRLRAQHASTRREATFDVLRPFLNPAEAADARYDAAAAELGLTSAALRQAVHRLRERFADVLRETVADTLQSPSPQEVDGELLALRAALQA